MTGYAEARLVRPSAAASQRDYLSFWWNPLRASTASLTRAGFHTIPPKACPSRCAERRQCCAEQANLR